jgi:hypothetical protein
LDRSIEIVVDTASRLSDPCRSLDASCGLSSAKDGSIDGFMQTKLTAPERFICECVESKRFAALDDQALRIGDNGILLVDDDGPLSLCGRRSP